MLTLACSFDPDARELMVLRAILRPYFESRNVPPGVGEDLVLVATELAANAIEAGSDQGEIRMRVNVAPDAAIIEVEDPGTGFGLAPADSPPSPHQDRGRGLWLVRTLTSELAVERQEPRTIVRAVRRWGGPAARVRPPVRGGVSARLEKFS
ncbi:MAG: ATP-binding protein [Acidimicrobiia bacterium]